eukprot:31303-Pelagococcus_subviridis.AAC.32
MSRAIEKNASSTFTFAFALVSKNGIPNSSASAFPRACEITRLSSMSHLFPTKILFTFSDACCSMFRIQFRTLLNDVSSVTSFTRLPSNSTVRILKSIPIVVINDVVNESSLNRRSRQLFPTPGGVRIEGGRIDGRREERRRERTRTRRRDATSDAGWAKRRRTTTDARRDGRGRLGPDDATDLTATARRRGRPAVFSLARDRSALAGAGTDAAAASARPRARSRATGRTAVSDEQKLDEVVVLLVHRPHRSRRRDAPFAAARFLPPATLVGGEKRCARDDAAGSASGGAVEPLSRSRVRARVAYARDSSTAPCVVAHARPACLERGRGEAAKVCHHSVSSTAHATRA